MVGTRGGTVEGGTEVVETRGGTVKGPGLCVALERTYGAARASGRQSSVSCTEWRILLGLHLSRRLHHKVEPLPVNALAFCSVGKQIVNIPSFTVRVDSQASGWPCSGPQLWCYMRCLPAPLCVHGCLRAASEAGA